MSKIIRLVLVLLIAAIFLIALITGLNILFFWSIFDWLRASIHNVTGFGITFSKALAALFVAVIAIMPLGRMLMSFSPIPQRNKGIYRGAVFVSISILFLLTFLGNRDVYFDPESGEPVKYYSTLPNGEYRIFDGPGYDPLTGDKLLRVIKEVPLNLKGIYPPPKSPEVKPVPGKDVYFDPKVGEAVKYYSILPNGDYRIFPDSGYDPLTGEKLRRVTKDIVLKNGGLSSSLKGPETKQDIDGNEFFDTKTGKAVKYYSVLPNGEYRIFSGPGYDPITGDTLKKVTREISLKAKGLWPSPKAPDTLTTPSNLKPETSEPTKQIDLASASTKPPDEREIRSYSPYAPKLLVAFSNTTDHTIVILDSYGNEKFRIRSGRKGRAVVQLGDYYYINKNGVKKPFTVKNSTRTLDFFTISRTTTNK